MEIRHARDIASRHGGTALVLTASRRTDMPAFHVDSLVGGLRQGAFHPQAMMGAMYKTRFACEEIHSIGLWSQDFGPWLARRAGLRDLPYRFWYRFTILPDDPVTKPRAPAVSVQLRQLEALVAEDGPGSVNLFIDPIVEYRQAADEPWRRNASDEAVEPILRSAGRLGLGTVTLSVLDRYPKVERRAEQLGIAFRFIDAARVADLDVLCRMVEPLLGAARRHGLVVRSCCEGPLTRCGLTERGACVDGPRLNALFGPGASSRPDAGQRRKLGCGCTMALDVGRYVEHGDWSHHCGHACPQCYARP